MTSSPQQLDAPVVGEAVDPEVELVLDRPGPWRMMRETWRVRQVIPRVGIRVIIKGISGTKLGRAWLVLRPVIGIFGMALIFGAVLDTPSQGLPYLVFLLFGTHAWLTFERSSFWGVRSFDMYRRIARTFNFPMLVVPVAGLIPAAIEWCVIGSIATVTLVVFSVLDGTMYLEVGPQLLLVPVAYTLLVLVGLTVTLWLAPLNARARDVRIVYRIMLQPWMFITPVVYPASQLPAGLAFLATINPVAAPVEMVRYGLFDRGTVEMGALAVTLITIVVLGSTGLWFFTREAPEILDRRNIPDEDEDEAGG